MKNESDIFNIADSTLEPIAGSLLVAKPTVDGDGCFERSVILMVTHDDTGSMGLILNHPTDLKLSDVLPHDLIVVDAPLYLGGPVQNDMLFFVHDLGPDLIPDAQAVGNGLYVGGDFDTLRRYVNGGGAVDGHIRFLSGYSGWAAGQLQAEVDIHSWAVLDDADAGMLLSGNVGDMWQLAVNRFGDRYRMWRNWPLDPTAN